MRLIVMSTIISLAFFLVFPLNAQPINPSHDDMFKRLSALVENGDLDVKYNLGMFFHNGIGTPVDRKAAFKLFSEAAAAGHALAAYKVGCYYAGQFPGAVEPDADLAFKSKLLSAEAGYDLAQTDIGMTLAKRGNLQSAVKWWERASRQGNNSATAFLAGYYAGPLSADKIKGLALLLKLRESVPQLPKNVADLLAAAESSATPKDRVAAKAIAASWVLEQSPITIEARRGITTVPKLLERHGR